MKKVYLNDKPIIFSNQIINDLKYDNYVYKNIRISEVLHKLKYSHSRGIVLYHYDLEKMWQDFSAYFEPVTAAGGLVENTDGQWLFIKRNNRWDLPKGKQEDKETTEKTAVREVEEECGISGLEVRGFIQSTFHIYTENQRDKLKNTYWFDMTYSGFSQPKPQKEEGITQAVFVKTDALDSMFSRMYKNVEDLVVKYLNL